MQEEFDALWSSPHAVRLADFVIQDLKRLSRRELVGEVSRWREEPDPAAVVVEAPIYRKEVGLWEHQKHFVKLAFDAHRGPHGARFVPADQVGLGKTLQLAMAAQLMALVGDGPVLVLAPKPLLQQWQDELDTLLDLPSAVWDRGQWPYLMPVRVRLHGDADADAITLPPFLEDAYAAAEQFCRLLGARANAGFFRTMLLRRMGSTIEAGRRTVARILDGWQGRDDDEEDEDGDAQLRALTDEERRVLLKLVQAMEANLEQDPKLVAVTRLLVDDGWLDRGCIVFSQYYDSVRWLANQLTRELPDEAIGVYAGANRSGVMRSGVFARRQRDELRDAVRRNKVRLLLGTEAASEGLNLQRLGTLINLDLPWNPSRLEQRKGRIQRIGQVRSEVDVYNMRYAGSVEDRVHELLSERLENISRLFGQLPDTLEDVWVQVALGQAEAARRTIDAVPQQHPFELRYREVSHVDWESCARVLDDAARRETRARGWQASGRSTGRGQM